MSAGSVSDATDTAPSSTAGRQHILDAPTARLCQAVADGSHAPARLAVIAPGQHGKTALLDRIERDRCLAGLPVRRFGSAPVPRDEHTLVLVDDAHDLSAADFEALHGYLRHERVGVVLAARPRPRPAELNSLLGVLRGQVVLRPLDLAQIGQYLDAAPHTPRTPGFAQFVREQTGGVAGFVRDLVDACELESHNIGPAGSGTVPAAALSGACHELDRGGPATLGFLLAAEAGAGLSFELLAELLGCEQDTVAEVVESARATGIFAADGGLLPVGAHALRALVPAQRRAAVRQHLAELVPRYGQPLLPMVRTWLDGPTAGPAVGGAFEAAAAEALPDEPALAARLFRAAVDAGREFSRLAGGWAQATALAGQFDEALRLTEKVLTSGENTAQAESARAEAARVAGIALAHKAQQGRSAELLEWSGTARSCAFAAVGYAATGRVRAAERVLRRAESADEPPSLLSGAVLATARGLFASVTGAGSGALSELVNAAETLEPVGRDVSLPDSPAALAAIVALHCGEPAVAESVLKRAIDARAGVSLLPRHRLLLGWTAMVRGDLGDAAAALGDVGGETPAPRDWLFAVALEVGIARRASDVAALRRAWERAREAVIRHPVDLFTLLPLGEFAVAAARLGEQDRMDPHLRGAWELLAELGEPPLWAGLSHWSGLHAAITAEQHARAREHADALRGCAEQVPYHGTLARAAHCWLRALAGDVDAVETEAAARDLRDAGMRWDGARLAGQAAIHTTDRTDMRALLDCARSLQAAGGGARARAEVAEGDVPVGARRLSGREREVAELVLTGMTYKEIGARLFISAKTVEHHVARMRQRLGATNRSELLAELRSLLET